MEPGFFSAIVLEPLTAQGVTNRRSTGLQRPDATDFFAHVPLEVQVLIGDNLCPRHLVSLMKTSRNWRDAGKRCTINKARSLGFTGEARYCDARSYLGLFFPQLYKSEKSVRRLVSAFLKKVPSQSPYLPQSTVKGRVSLLRKVDEKTGHLSKLPLSLLTKQHLKDFFSHYLELALPEEAYQQFSLLLPAGGTQTGVAAFQTVGLFAAALSNEKELFMRIWNSCWTQATEGSSEIEVLPYLADNEGNNLMHMAAYMGHTELLRAIYSIDRSSARACMLATNSSDETPYDMALSAGHRGAENYLSNRFSTKPFRPFSLLKFSFKQDLPNCFKQAIYLFCKQPPQGKEADQLLSFLADEGARLQKITEGAASPQIQPGVRLTHIHTAVRSLIRAGLKYKDASHTGYDFASDLALESTRVFFKYFAAADLASRFLAEKKFSELTDMLTGHMSSQAAIDCIIGFSIQGHKNALEFAGSGIVEKDESASFMLLTYFIHDFRFWQTDLKDGDILKRHLIEQWLPESQEKRNILIENAVDAGLQNFTNFLVELSKKSIKVIYPGS